MVPQLPLSQKGAEILAHVYCNQTAGWIKMALGTEVSLGPGDIVLDGKPGPPKRGTAACIRIPLGMEVGLSLGDIVLDGDPAPLP